jgi:hypothetical protein
VRIGVTISRDYDDYDSIVAGVQSALREIDEYPPNVTLVHGASQMDWFVAGVAHMLGMPTEPHRANWAKLGKAAGPARNQEMVDDGPYALWLSFVKGGSSGATDCTQKADEAGIPIRKYVQ